MKTRTYVALWATWAGAGLALEGASLRDKDRGDTLTEQVRGILKQPFLWWAGVGLSVWAFLHFFFNRK